MALLFMDGFDLYTSQADMGTKWNAYTSYISQQTSVVRFAGTNSGALYVNQNSAWVTKNVPAGSVFIVGFAFRCSNITQNASYPNWLVALYDGAAPGYQIELTLNPVSGILQITKNNTATVLATGTTALSANVWYYIEFQGVISSSVSANTCFVNLNGVREVTVPGSTSTQNTVNSTATQIRLGASQWDNGLAYFDDFYLCDNTGSVNNAPLGVVRIESIVPASDGASTSWTANSGANQYSRVDQVPADGDTTYTGSATVNQIDTFAMQALSSTPSAIFGVQLSLYARVDDATVHTVSPYIYFATTGYTQAALSISAGGTYAYYTAVYAENPSTSAAWGNSDIGNTEFGFELAS